MWTFVLLGPKKTAYETAEAIGIPRGNVRVFADARELEGGFDSTKKSIGSYMDARARGVSQTDDFFLPPKSGA
jgi:hypothetical protein